MLVLAGCDQVFGLGKVPVDAAPDAAPACPPLGTAPRFRSAPFPLTTSCDHYVESVAPATAMAWCFNGPTQSVIAQGQNDSLSAAPGIVPVSSTGQLEMPRIFPEGDQVIVRERDLTKTPNTLVFDDFVRAPGQRWSFAMTIVWPALFPPGSGIHDEVSVPTFASPERRIFYSNTFNTDAFYELADPGTGWTTPTPPSQGKYTLADLEPAGATLTAILEPNPTPDGLRLVFIGRQANLPSSLFYADRADVHARFGTAQPVLPTLPNITDADLTEDCGALFYSLNNNGQSYRIEP